MKPTIKLLHTADMHLGAKFNNLGAQGAAQRARLRETALEIAELAVQERVDLLLVAGDTFDSNRPSPESVSAFRQMLQKAHAHRIPLLIIAGTHDPLIPDGILARLQAENEGSMHLLTPENPTWTCEERRIQIQGVSLLGPEQPARPVAGLRRLREDHWQVGMVHAALEADKIGAHESRFSQKEIAASGLDYLALGHWHSKRNCSSGSTTAWYSGAPEMIAMDEGEPGSVQIVSLEEGQSPKVFTHRTGRRSLLQLVLPAHDLDAVVRQAKQSADPDGILHLTLTGQLEPGEDIDAETVRRALIGDFFFVQVKDQSLLMVNDQDLQRFPEHTVAGRFFRNMQQEIEKAEPEKQDELRHALQLGLAMLQGRDVRSWS